MKVVSSLSWGCTLEKRFISFPFSPQIVWGGRFRVLFFLSGENRPFNIKLSNCSKKTQANETSAQIWENIRPSPHLIRKMICWIVSHAAHQQTAPSRATATSNIGERCQQLWRRKDMKGLGFLMPAAVWITFAPSCTTDKHWTELPHHPWCTEINMPGSVSASWLVGSLQGARDLDQSTALYIVWEFLFIEQNMHTVSCKQCAGCKCVAQWICAYVYIFVYSQIKIKNICSTLEGLFLPLPPGSSLFTCA